MGKTGRRGVWRRTWKRKGRPAVTTRKGVARIARAVVKRAEETKKFNFATNLNLQDGAIYVYNPMFGLVPGLDMANYTGQRVQNVVLRVNWSFWPQLRTNLVQDWQGCIIRILFIKANTRTGSLAGNRFQLAPSGLQAADIFENTLQSANESVNTEKVTVVRDIKRVAHKFSSNSTLVNQPDFGVPICGVVYVPVAKLWQYEDAATGYGRNRQFYMVVTALMYGAAGSSHTVGNMSLSTTVTFKDS